MALAQALTKLIAQALREKVLNPIFFYLFIRKASHTRGQRSSFEFVEKVNNAPVLEIQPEASFAALSGFDFDTVQVFDHVDSKELIGLYFDPYANQITQWLTS